MVRSTALPSSFRKCERMRPLAIRPDMAVITTIAGALLFAVGAMIAYLNYRVILVEEARLKEAFADSYERYRSSVRRWM